VGEQQGEVGELTVVILFEEGHWVALSMVRVEDAEEEVIDEARRAMELLGEGRGSFGKMRGRCGCWELRNGGE